MNQLASQLPSIDRLLKSKEGRSLVAEHGRIRVSETLRGIVGEAREQIQRGEGDLTNRDWIAEARARLASNTFRRGAKMPPRRQLQRTGAARDQSSLLHQARNSGRSKRRSHRQAA